jgi:hypothetical protein
MVMNIKSYALLILGIVPQSMALNNQNNLTLTLPTDIDKINLNISNNNRHVITQVNNNNGSRLQIDDASPATRLSHSVHAHTPTGITHYAQSLARTCWAHKGKAAIASLLAGYGIVIATLHYLEHVTTKTTCWSSWQAALSTSQLKSMPQEALAQQLFAAIKTRYLPAHYTTAHFLDPIVHFKNESAQELHTLERQLKIHNVLCYTKLACIVPGHASLMARALDKAERLHYLQEILITHVHDYSLPSPSDAKTT